MFPLRTGSGLGGVSMLERSSSHKSEGRQSSTHSTRLNSLALDSRSPALEGITSVGPPPGLLLIGPHPSIIRCWLDSNFSNESLLYAAICTGSYTSLISSRIAQRLGSSRSNRDVDKISLTVYFPEATIYQGSTRALDLIPQVPSISAEFEVFDASQGDDSIQVIIGSDVLRTKNADISFSQERVTLFDDEHHKLAIPLVRPENPNTFHRLRTSSGNNSPSIPSTAPPGGHDSDDEAREQAPVRTQHNLHSTSTVEPSPRIERTTSSSRTTLNINTSLDESSVEALASSRSATEPQREMSNGIRSNTPVREKEVAMWGNWRRENGQSSSATETTFSSVASNTNSQSGLKGRGMKVLRPTRSSQSRSVSTAQTSNTQDSTTSRWQDAQPIRGAPSVTSESGGSQLASPRRSFSHETRTSVSNSANKPRPSNPAGGGSAFGWLNPVHK